MEVALFHSELWGFYSETFSHKQMMQSPQVNASWCYFSHAYLYSFKL
jgi:hypothetical protein